MYIQHQVPHGDKLHSVSFTVLIHPRCTCHLLDQRTPTHPIPVVLPSLVCRQSRAPSHAHVAFDLQNHVIFLFLLLIILIHWQAQATQRTHRAAAGI